jgi:hypothetical protein
MLVVSACGDTECDEVEKEEGRGGGEEEEDSKE